mmetsp:Transcript_23720/g.60908  ORF Transcript_23720/g.60908 Transcript_23720/m.60908 type:complete len:205 (+) Transcript_23720:542-1156(+)
MCAQFIVQNKSAPFLQAGYAAAQEQSVSSSDALMLRNADISMASALGICGGPVTTRWPFMTGCASACSAVMRWAGFFSSRRSTRSRMAGETVSHSLSTKGTVWYITRSSTSLGLTTDMSSHQGNRPVTNTYIIMPNDHKSASSVKHLRKTSGAKYAGVPQRLLKYTSLELCFCAQPKSTARTPRMPASWIKFAGLISPYRTPRS